jgi:hypothetical protein
MIKPEQVPPGLALIARKAWAEGVGPTNDDDWNAAIAAALAAWPGKWQMEMTYPDDKGYCDNIILPLTQQASDDQ